MNFLKHIANLDSHHRLMIAGGLSAAVFVSLGGRISPAARIFVTWDFLLFCLLAMIWVTITMSDPQKVRRTASLQDSSRTAIFVFVIIAACASLLALFFLLGSAKNLPKQQLSEHVALSLLTIICSWSLVHTVFALRYAHSFYLGHKASGLDFPGTKAPDYMDFAYFSFVIGMTCQVSDVQITSCVIRRLALTHGVVSFAFNTAILALTINIISGLLS